MSPDAADKGSLLPPTEGGAQAAPVPGTSFPADSLGVCARLLQTLPDDLGIEVTRFFRELQVTNAELLSTNEDLRQRNAETTRLNNDLTNLLNSINIPVLVLGRDRRIRHFTAGAEKILRLLPTGGGQPLGARKSRIRGADLDRLILEVLDSSALQEREVQDEDGRWYLLSIRPCQTPDNTVDGVVLTLEDVTQREKAIEQAVQSERLAAIGEMVTGLAHESGNALQGMQACLERLTLRLRDRPDLLDLVRRIHEEQDRLRRLYEDVRSYASPWKVDYGPCHLAEVWQRAFAHLRAVHPERQLVLQENDGNVDLNCEADACRLEQVFRNILHNSLEVCPGPVRIDLCCTETALDNRPAVRVRIRDNGPGLTVEQRQRIFEPFFTTKAKATGLGMAISKRIVEAHGGRILLGEDSQPGTELVIVLPRRGT